MTGYVPSASGHRAAQCGHVTDSDAGLRFVRRHVQLKADMSQLYLLHGTDNKKVGNDQSINQTKSASYSRHGIGSHFVTQRPSDTGIHRPGDPVDPVTLFYIELQMSTYV